MKTVNTNALAFLLMLGLGGLSLGQVAHREKSLGRAGEMAVREMGLARPVPESRTAWDADAGLIASFTVGANVTASSNPSGAGQVLDDDLSTAWQSDAPLPEGFIRREDQNIFLQKAGSLLECPTCRDMQNMTDGDLSTAAFVKKNEQAGFSINLGKDDRLFSLSIKCQVKAPLTIQFVDENDRRQPLGVYAPADNFSLKRWEVKGGRAKAVVLTSDADFDVFEIAALAGLPKEFIVVDLGSHCPIGTIYTRHWAGDDAAASTKIYLSDDKRQWIEVASPDPAAIHEHIANVHPEKTARFIKVEHELYARDWNKVFVWEVRAYNRYGHYGPRPVAMRGHTKIRELLGVNGYWSWGTDQYSDLLAPDGGPFRYAPIASHARNYHDMTWDIDQPGQAIDFKKMAAGQGTPAKDWVNWDREYQAWKAAGHDIQASLQFYRYDPSLWKKPWQEGYDYAYSFVQHFGPKHGNGLVCTVEAGNEPWAYPADIYRQILLGMATGAKAADPGIEMFPCALQAADPSAETQGIFKNYMGARIPEEAAPLLDGINIHAYSYVSTQKGKRQAVHPEHPNSTFWEVLNAIRWRNHNMPGKKIYLSEWGWDSAGGGEDCTHSECVGEHAAAVYAVRAALIAARLGFDRATWFYYANDKSGSSLYTRSGLTGSGLTGFKKKQVFLALQSLVERVGDRLFHSVVREDETAWMYLLCDESGEVSHLIAWLPEAAEFSARKTVSWATHFSPIKAVLLDGNNREVLVDKRNGAIHFELTPNPVLVYLK